MRLAILVPAIAIIAIGGCGGSRTPEAMAQEAVRTTAAASHHAKALDGARSKQDLVARYIERPEQRDTLTISEADRIARLIAANNAIAYGVSGVSEDRRKAFSVRYAELPSEAEYLAAQPVPAKPPMPAAQPVVLPIVDHRALAARIRTDGITIADPAAPSAWSAVPDTEDRDYLGVYAAAGVVFAWGPQGSLFSPDAGATWEAGVPAIAGTVLRGRAYGLDAEGNVISPDGYQFDPDLPRLSALIASGDHLVAMSKSKLVFLATDGKTIRVAAKHDRDPASILVGAGGNKATLASPDGSVMTYDLTGSAPLRPGSAGPTAVGRAPDGYRPATPIAYVSGVSSTAAYADGGMSLATAPPSPLTSWCVAAMGSVDERRLGLLLVRPDGLAADILIHDTHCPQAAASLPAGTRAVVAVGDTLIAATSKGIWTAPAR